MNPYARLLFVMAGAATGIFVLQCIVTRMLRALGCPPLPPQIVAARIIFFGNIPLVVAAWFLALKGICSGPLDAAFGVAYVIAGFNAIGFCYFNVLNASETSLSVHILMELLAQGGALERDELSRIYGVDGMVSARIDRMIALGQLQDRDGRFVLSSRKLVWTGQVMRVWRRVLSLPDGPWDTVGAGKFAASRE